MTPEQTLIQQISQIIENGLLEKNALLEDYAVQYAELCAAVNTRLLRCADFLEKDLLSEAMYSAHQAPDLLVLVSIVQFPFAKKWHNICMDLELTQPPLLHTEVVEKLQKANISEIDLKPLLQMFRKYIYQHQHREALEVLREIRSQDPKNTNWIDNLRILEEEELPEWLEKLKQALAKKDMAQLKVIDAELQHPQRVAKAPEESMQKLRYALLSERRTDLLAEGNALMEDMKHQLTSDSEKGVQKLLSRIAEMEKDEAFTERPERWKQMHADADHFIQKVEKEQSELKAHEIAEQEFKDLLESGKATDLDLRQALARLQEDEYPVNELLVSQMNEQLAERGKNRNLRIKSVVCTVVGVVIFLCIMGGFWFNKSKQNHLFQVKLNKIKTMVKLEQLSEADALLNDIQREYPKNFEKTEIIRLQKVIETKQQKIAENKKLTSMLWAEMLLAEKNLFNISDAQARAWQDRAAVLSWTLDEQMKLKEWQSAWLRQKKLRVQDSNSFIRQLNLKIKSIMENNQGVVNNELLPEIKDLQNEIQEVRSKAIYADEALRLSLDQQFLKLKAWANDISMTLAANAAQEKAQQEKIENLKKLQQKLPEFLLPTDLNPFFDKMQSLLSLNELKFNNLYGKISEQREQQSSAFLLHDFQDIKFPMDSDMEKKLQSCLQNQAKNTVWESDLRNVLAWDKKQRDARASFPEILAEQPEMFQLYQMKYRKKGDEDWKMLYMPKLLSHRMEIQKFLVGGGRPVQEHLMRYMLYWGNVYFWQNDMDKPMLTHTSKIFTNGLNSMEYEVAPPFTRDEDNLCPQGKFLMQTVTEAADVSELNFFLLKKIEFLQKTEKIGIVPGFWLQKRLIHFVQDHLPLDIPKITKAVSQYDVIDTNIPWMNLNHPDVVKAQKQIKSAGIILTDIDAIIEQTKLQRALYLQSLNFKPHCIGGLFLTDGFLALRRNNSMEKISELWVLFTDATRGLPKWVLLSEDGKKLDPDVLKRCLAGQPVFAPIISTLEWRRQNAALLIKYWAQLQQPSSWPANAWKKP
ncbi:MAG: hypothetical protein WCS73_02070 [Lentisphaeria bacterium]